VRRDPARTADALERVFARLALTVHHQASP